MATDRLLPRQDPESAPYWEAAERGELLIRRCGRCDRAHWYPRPHCPYCHADGTVWERAIGGGVIYTYTVVHQNGSSAFRDLVPYAIGMVDLAEGPRWFGFLRGDPATVAVGASASVAFERIGDVSLPVFEVRT